MAFNKIRMVLGRTKDFPDGSYERGYDLIAPLDKDGKLDVEAWRENKDRCTVTRFWHNEPDEHGNLIHTRHRTWAFSYEPGEDDDEPAYRLEDHVLLEGEYVTITETDGQSLPFKIISVRPA